MSRHTLRQFSLEWVEQTQNAPKRLTVPTSTNSLHHQPHLQRPCVASLCCQTRGARISTALHKKEQCIYLAQSLLWIPKAAKHIIPETQKKHRAIYHTSICERDGKCRALRPGVVFCYLRSPQPDRWAWLEYASSLLKRLYPLALDVVSV